MQTGLYHQFQTSVAFTKLIPFIQIPACKAGTIKALVKKVLMRVDLFNSTVCNFQSMKSPLELNSLFSKFFCYITWFVTLPD